MVLLPLPLRERVGERGTLKQRPKDAHQSTFPLSLNPSPTEGEGSFYSVGFNAVVLNHFAPNINLLFDE